MMEVINTEMVWEGPSWRLEVETLKLPDKHVLKRGHIIHPGSVVLIPRLEDRRLLIIKQYRRAIDQTILELPAGTRKWDEDWLVCAQRELREETGYRAGKLTYLGEFWPAPGLSSELMRFYLAEDLAPDPLPADADEEIEEQPMLLADLLKMVQDGRIKDAKTILGAQIMAAATQT